jgi:hypothetical protein
MEKDFHYYLIYSIARITGFQDADIIAYSSQFVDDNNEGQFSIEGKKVPFPNKIRANGGYYYPIMTQSLSPKSLDMMIQKYVYVPFHFLPGNSTTRINGETNALSTKPNSKNARILLENALKSDNPYLIGIALHTYGDTWSHQNFTGLQEEWNSVYPWYRFDKSIAPNIGHAEVQHSPDIISEKWTDNRFGIPIDNRKRALLATAEIYKAMRKKSGKGPVWTGVKSSFRRIIYAAGYDDRKAKINEFMHERNLEAVPRYSKNKWIDAALDRKYDKNRRRDKILMKPIFKSTQWYHFQQAAKVHFATAMNLIKEL